MYHPQKTEILGILKGIAHTGGSSITYKELNALLSVPFDPTLLFARLSPILSEISTDEHAEGRPLISVLAVNSMTGVPGFGFFHLAQELGFDVSDMEGFVAAQRRLVADAWHGKA